MDGQATGLSATSQSRDLAVVVSNDVTDYLSQNKSAETRATDR